MNLQFLVHIVLTPGDTSEDELNSLREMESKRAAELASQGHLLKLWRLSEGWSNVGVWAAADRGELERVLDSLPLRRIMTIDIKPLQHHPNDPAVARGDCG